MEPTDLSPGEDDEQDRPESPLRPWGPGSPAPGTPVSAFDVRRDEEAKLEASEATALYESARFPDLEDVARPSSAAPAGSGGAAGKENEEGERSGLRILGVPAPKEIAGPIVAALALAALVYGWRRRRRRRRA